MLLLVYIIYNTISLDVAAQEKKIGTDWITVALLYLQIDGQFAPVTLSWNQNQVYRHTLTPLASDLPYAERLLKAFYPLSRFPMFTIRYFDSRSAALLQI